MISAKTNAWGRAGGVEWVSCSRQPLRNSEGGTWTMRTLRGQIERPLGKISRVRPRIERRGDRRLGDAIFYCAVATMAAPAFLPASVAPWIFLAALIGGFLAGVRWEAGILALDVSYRNGERETVRIWDLTEPMLSVARELDLQTGGPGIVRGLRQQLVDGDEVSR